MMRETSAAKINLTALLLGMAGLVSGAESDPANAVSAGPEVVDFDRDIYPILDASCLDCHDRDTLKGGVGLETFYHASLPTDAGDKLIAPGDPEASVLFHVLLEEDPEKRMPPKGGPLDPEDIEILRRWIEQGAVWPDDGWRPEVHWSFEAPEQAEPPVADEVIRNRDGNEIDRFIAQKLADNELSLNELAVPARLIRRAALDLTGLPPTAAMVSAFEADSSTAHYEKLIDQLLADPAFGERWATPWLDLARYADSEGYQRDSPRNMWPYRDWVIAALNEDMPFDQFSIEQLAGDLLPDPTESQLVATAFHRNAAMNIEAGTDPKEDHYKMVVDRTNTTGTIWMGLTVGCAQCHNHKYDPITAKEYYELFAFFNNSPMESAQQGEGFGMSGLNHIGEELKVERTPEELAFEAVVTKQLQRENAAINRLARELAAAQISKLEESEEPVPEEVLSLLALESVLSPKQVQDLVKLLKLRNPSLNRKIAEQAIHRSRYKAQAAKTVRITRELADAEMRPTFVAKRGDFLAQGEQVTPGTPASMHPFPADAPRNRLGLAHWLVSPENPLVARAFINRLWIEIFGQGLVTTPEDFGSEGALPTHPELLDWLAVAFVEEDGWSLKKAVRRIVLSATYRQSVAMNHASAEADPRNQLLWRHPGHRLSAEMIRDQALSIAGLLSDRMHGVHSRPYQPDTVWTRTAGSGELYYLPSEGEDAYRRAVYTIWRRNNPYPSMVNFDATDRGVCVVQRDLSNTPLQSLTLLNDPVYVEAAAAFGERIASEGGKTIEQQIEWAFREALARAPREPEIQLLRSAYTAELGISKSKERAYRELAIILLNLHESINRS
ncbi:MAG: PSD1 and planctomycete cytochrome C domain-containing protein [Verrucomicrobiota bacterium]